MFADWDNFYLLVGSAAAGLIGLLFVVSTLTAGGDRARLSRANKIYLSPTVLSFAIVVLISGIAFMPRLPALPAGLAIGAAALVGLAFAALTTIRIARRLTPTPPHWTDLPFYGALPGLAYVCVAFFGLGVAVMPDAAPAGIAVGVMALILIGVRNAWDLVTWVAAHPRAAGGTDATL